MLVLMVLLLVIVDAVILSVYTVLEANGKGASLVVNREKEITVITGEAKGREREGVGGGYSSLQSRTPLQSTKHCTKQVFFNPLQHSK